jgi:hypothetical protein
MQIVNAMKPRGGQLVCVKLQKWRSVAPPVMMTSDGARTQTANGLLRSVQTVGVPTAGSIPPIKAQDPLEEEEEHAEQPAEATAASQVYHIHHSNVYFATGCAAVPPVPTSR